MFSAFSEKYLLEAINDPNNGTQHLMALQKRKKNYIEVKNPFRKQQLFHHHPSPPFYDIFLSLSLSFPLSTPT
jgi:hypothetical protein